jgi:hypothetical protein
MRYHAHRSVHHHSNPNSACGAAETFECLPFPEYGWDYIVYLPPLPRGDDVARNQMPSNKPMQLTPLRVREIGAFLKRRIGPKSVPIYRWRRN